MKQHSKNIKLELGNHLKFNVEISKEKVLLHPSFSLFNIGTQKNISCALCIVRQNTSSVFNFNNYITTSFNIRIYEESYQYSKVLRVVSPFGQESYFYATDDTYTIFYNNEQNIKVLKKIVNGKTKYTFLNSNEDEVTYTMGLFGGVITTPVEYKFKHSVNYNIDLNAVASSLNGSSFNGPKVDFEFNDDGSISKLYVYTAKYIPSATNKYKLITFEYTNTILSKIIYTSIDGKIDTYNISISNQLNWRFEHLETGKFFDFVFDSTGNLISFTNDNIGIANSTYISTFNSIENGIKIVYKGSDIGYFVFDENNNLQYEFDKNGYLLFYEYTKYKKDYLISSKSSPHNISFNKVDEYNLFDGNFSNQALSGWTFNSGGAAVYSVINSTLGQNYNIFTNGYGVKVTVPQSTTVATLKTDVNTTFSNRKFILSGFFKPLSSPDNNSLNIILLSKYKDNYTQENLVLNFDTSNIGKTNFFMKEIYFHNDVDSIEITIEIYKGATIELYDFSLLDEFYGTHYLYNENGIIYKTISGFDTTKTKIHQGNIKALSFYNKNLSFEDEETDTTIKKITHSSNNFKTTQTISKTNGYTIEEESNYNDGMYKNKKAYNYSDDGLLLSSNTNLFSTEYSYYLNTDLKSQMKVFDYNGSNKLNYEYNYSGSSVITSIKSISSTLYRTATNNSYISSSVYILEHNTNLYNYSYDEEDNLLNFKYNNIVYFTNSYLKGNYDHQKLLNTVTLNQSTSNYSIFYNSYDLPTQISFNNLTIFNFIYDEVFNLTRVNLFESDHFYQYEYDNMNDLVKKSSPIESIEINKYRSNIQHTKETYVNYSSINFKQKYENKNSVILNDLLSTLKECNAYIGLFDCLIDPEETDPDFKYLKLIKDYYKKDDFISINPLFNSSGPYLYNIFNLKYLRLYNKDHFTFTAPHPIIDNKVCGNIGFSYLINRHFIGRQSLISFNILNYSFKISYILGETCYINFLVQIGTTILLNKNYEFSSDIEVQRFINLSYEISSTDLTINLYANNVFDSLKFSNNSILIPQNVTFKIFEPLAGTGIDYYNEYFVTGIIFNNQKIKFNEILHHFNTIDKIINLSEIYKENYDLCPNGSGSSYYINPSSQFTWIPLRDTFKDSNGDFPISNFGYNKPFVFHLMTLGNCYHSYKNKLVYKTNLSDKGALSFKTKIFKIFAEQTYFQLNNGTIKIKMFVDESKNIKLKINETIISLFAKTEEDLIAEHFITFSYNIVNGVMSYSAQFSNQNPFTNTISLETNNTTENFDLYLGCADEYDTFTDVNNKTYNTYKNTLNGIISDVVYTNKLDSLTFNNSLLNSYKHPVISDCFNDVFGREYQKRAIYKNKMVINEKYDYLTKNNNITSLVGKEKLLINTTQDSFNGLINRTFSYEYDSQNRVTKLIEKTNENNDEFTEKIEYEYQYDDCSYLRNASITKTNRSNGVNSVVFSDQFNYSYNSIGDMISERHTISGVTTTNNLQYASNIKHQLTKFGNNTLIYDGLYLKEIRDNTGTVVEKFTYRGTKLTNYQNLKKNINLNFFYDHEGRRIRKHNLITNEVIYFSYDLSGRLTRETHPSYALSFLYDEKGRLFSFVYDKNGTQTPYFYVRNALNDITEVIDLNGNIITKYIYDPYGKVIHQLNGNPTISLINPILYKEYYFDNESQLFWVSSRYYSPELCRWISPDSIQYLDHESINGLNLYTYCNNNPINYYDPTGHSAILIGLVIGAFIGAGIGFGTVVYTDYQDDGQIFNGSVKWYEYMGGTLTGAVLGAGVGGIIGAGGAPLISALASTGKEFISDLFAYALTGAPFGTREDYALAFICGGMTEEFNLKGIKKIAFDVVAIPAISQIVKLGTNRTETLSVEKYAYDIIINSLVAVVPSAWKDFIKGGFKSVWDLYSRKCFA